MVNAKFSIRDTWKSLWKKLTIKLKSFGTGAAKKISTKCQKVSQLMTLKNEPIITPLFPHRSPIIEGLQEGKCIIIKGRVPYGADRFIQVNLPTTLNWICDRPLHLSIRLWPKTVLINTYQNQSWDDERYRSFPIGAGRSFTLVFEVDKFDYKISVNGTHCWDFPHRIPYKKVSSLVIDYDLFLIEQIEYISKMPDYPTPVTPSTPVDLDDGFSDKPQDYPTPVTPSTPVNLDDGFSDKPQVSQLMTLKSEPIITPSIPFRSPILEGLHEGKCIKIKGQVPYGADRFIVNLQTGLDWMCDRPLHLSIRLWYNIVARNTYQNQSWGIEERYGSFPFTMGSSFTLVIEVERYAYKISVNGAHYWNYRHRIPYNRVSSLVIDGDVILELIEYINKIPHFPTPATSSAPVSFNGGLSDKPQISQLMTLKNEPNIAPLIPYRSPILDGLHEGKCIEIKGRVPYGADRFTVNLQTALDWICDRPLHLSIRFFCNTVVRNTYRNQSWGDEERYGTFPFTMGKSFTLVIEIDRFAYKIFVDGTHCWDYPHRIPYNKVNALVIDGDVILELIEYSNKIPHYQTPATPSAAVSLSEGISGQPQILPCTFPIHGGVKPGMSIYINGRPTENPQKFSVNIQTTTAIYPNADIAFHFDVRFFSHSVVRNSRVNGVWSSEETMISHFPFVPGVNFDMIIKVQHDSYVIMLNGEHFLSFGHRLNEFPLFNVLSIENDVIVTSVRYT